MVISDYLMDQVNWKAGWKSVSMEYGAVFAVISGGEKKLVLPADNWDFLKLVYSVTLDHINSSPYELMLCPWYGHSQSRLEYSGKSKGIQNMKPQYLVILEPCGGLNNIQSFLV